MSQQAVHVRPCTVTADATAKREAQALLQTADQQHLEGFMQQYNHDMTAPDAQDTALVKFMSMSQQKILQNFAPERFCNLGAGVSNMCLAYLNTLETFLHKLSN